MDRSLKFLSEKDLTLEESITLTVSIEFELEQSSS